MPKSKQSKPAKSSKSGRNASHLNCSCFNCKKAANPAYRYIMRTPALAKLMSEHAPSRASVSALLQARASALLGGASNRFAQVLDEGNYGRLCHHIPGVVALGRFVGDGEQIPLSVHLSPFEIWGQDVADGGLTALRGVLEHESANAVALGEKPLDAALWLTGFFDKDTPMHVVACDNEGNATYAVVAMEGIVVVSAKLMGAALGILQAAHFRSAFDSLGEPDTGSAMEVVGSSRAAVARHSSALDYAFDICGRLKNEADGVASAFAVEKAKLIAAHASEKQELLAEALARRRAAVATKNMQLSKVAGQVKRLERDFALTRSAAPAPGVTVSPVVCSAIEVEQDARSGNSGGLEGNGVVAALDDDAVDDGAVYWRETAEHQSEVIRQLRLALVHSAQQAATKAPLVCAPVLQRKLSDLGDWAAENSDRIIVLKRAINGAKKSDYIDDAFAYKALDMLATTYREVKLGLADRMDLKTRCDELGLDIGGSVSDLSVADEYFFAWQGRRRFLDQHIGRGNSRDPRYCFRAYFTWDEDEGKVILGWAPSHLPTRSS